MDVLHMLCQIRTGITEPHRSDLAAVKILLWKEPTGISISCLPKWTFCTECSIDLWCGWVYACWDEWPVRDRMSVKSAWMMGLQKRKRKKKQNKNKNFGCQIKTDKSPVLLCKPECVKVKTKKQTKTMQNASMIHSAHLCKQSWSIAAIAYIVSSIILFLFAGSRCCAVWNEWGETHQRIRQHAGNWGTDQPVCAKITLETSEEPIQVLFLCRRNSSRMFLCCYACQCTKHIKQCMQKERLQTFIVLALCVRREYFTQCVLYNITITGKILKKEKKRRRASWVLESGTSGSRRLTFWWG